MNKRVNLALIAGGPSSEHEVSLSSSVNILKSLDNSKYAVREIKIEKDGRWLIDGQYFGVGAALEKMAADKIEFAFIALHGTFGEDGSLQSLLDAVGIKYQGSGRLGSALAMDKIKSNELFEFHGLTVPRFVGFTKKNFEASKDAILKFFSEQGVAVLKPSDGGSSAGTFVIRSPDELWQKINETFEVSDNLMLQEYIEGDEITCGVLEVKDVPRALPPTQIIAEAGQFYDYKSKYAAGGSRHIVPAPYSAKMLEDIQAIALKAHKILYCGGLSRTDILLKDDQLYILETNTLPGFTSTSLFPEQAQVAGIGYSELLDILIEGGMQK